jgi:hypothetical protein
MQDSDFIDTEIEYGEAKNVVNLADTIFTLTALA